VLLSWPGGGQHIAGSKANAYANRFAFSQRYAFHKPHPYAKHHGYPDHHPHALADGNRNVHPNPYRHLHTDAHLHDHKDPHRQQHTDRNGDPVAFGYPQRDACFAFSYPLTFLFSHHTQYA